MSERPMRVVVRVTMLWPDHGQTRMSEFIELARIMGMQKM